MGKTGLAIGLVGALFGVGALAMMYQAQDQLEEERARKLALEESRTQAEQLMKSCNAPMEEVVHARKAEDARLGLRFFHMKEGLEKAQSCIRTLLPQIAKGVGTKWRYQNAATGVEILEVRMARVGAEIEMLRNLDQEQTRWFLSSGGIVFDYQDSRERFLRAFDGYKASLQRMKTDPDPLWAPELFWDQLPHALASTSADRPTWSASKFPEELAEGFLEKLKLAVNDGALMANLVHFPMSYADGVESFSSPEEFIPLYDAGIKLYLIDAVEAQTTETLFVNETGASIGRGQLWFGCRPESLCASAEDLRVLAIHPRKKS